MVSFAVALAGTVGSAAVAETAPSAAGLEPDVVNAGFEEPLADGKVTGWAVPGTLYPGTSFTVTDELAYEGTQSLRLADDSTERGILIESEHVAISAGLEYSARGMLNVERSRASIFLRFWDADGVQLTSNAHRLDVTDGQWQPATVTQTAPENAVSATVLLYSATADTGLAYFDDIELTTSGVRNGGFEEPLRADGSAPGWTLDGALFPQISYGVTDALAHTGSRSMRIDDGSAERGIGIESDHVDIAAGQVYSARAKVSIERSRASIYLRFYDEGGVRLTNNAHRLDVTDGQWEDAAVTQTAPVGAATATVLLYSATADTALAAFDDVEIVPVDAQEPPPDNGTPTPEEIEAADPNITHIGAPVTSRRINNTVLADEDGRAVVYGVYSGVGNSASPAAFVVADALTGEVVRALPVPGADGAVEVRMSTDGRAYFGTNRDFNLWRYDPATQEIENVGPMNGADPGAAQIWSLAAAEDGVMYVGTYPRGIVYRYDPADGRIEDLGVIDETQAYVRALAYDAERGQLYAGVGGNRAQIYRIDVATWEKTPLLNEENAPGAQDESFMFSFNFADDRLFVRGGTSQLLVITAEDEVEYWTGIDRERFGYHITPRPDAPGKYIFTLSSFWEYDAATGTTRNLNIPSNGTLNDARWVQLDDPEWPGWTLIGATSNGAVQVNFQTGRQESAAIEYRNPAVVQKILTGPDSLYASGYTTGLASFDTVTGEIGPTVDGGQYESSVVRDGKMLIGAYGSARVLEYDPTTGAAPRQLFDLEDENQDRPFGLSYDEDGDRLFIGTVPKYGSNQGALAVYDFETQQKTVYTDEIVEDQSVIDVLYHDGLVYLGTTLDGGLGAVPSGQTDAHFIVFDPDTGEVVHDFIPVAGDEGVTGLVLGPDGLIWGVSEDTVFKYDPASEEIVYSEKLLGDRYGTSTVWAFAYLVVGADGNVYGTNRYQFFKIDAETMEYTQILDGIGNYANVDAGGDVVFANGINVYKYDVPEDDTAPVEVTPEHVVFTDENGTEDDAYTIPSVAGVEYLVDGAVVEPGTYPGSGVVSVTARAGEGYVLDEDATTEWSHTFAEDEPEEPGGIGALRAAVEGYVAAGDIAGPIAHQLRNSLDQAERHLEDGRTTPAMRALERFVRHLEHPKRPDTLSEAAQAALIARAERLLENHG